MANILQHAKSVSEFESKDVQWVIPYWIPKGAITLLAGTGGIGKTNLWCYILSCISSMRPTMLHDTEIGRKEEEEKEPPAPEAFSEEDLAYMRDVVEASGGRLELGDVVRYFELLRERENAGTPKMHKDAGKGEPYNMTCMYFSAEDPAEVLKKQFEAYGAETDNIITVDYQHLGGLSFASKDLEELIREYRPAICVFDPIQAFMPRGASMTSRQQAREALDHLVRLGETYGTAFLLVCHTNKKKTDDWRQRISGSADLPDIARSVIFTDYTEIKPHQEIRFISNEKNSYHSPQETVLYHFDEGKLVYCGFSAKKFADYANDMPFSMADPTRMTQTDYCKQTILETLRKTGEISSTDLNKVLKDEGYSRKAIDLAKPELEKEGKVERFCTSANGRPQWRIRLREEQ